MTEVLIEATILETVVERDGLETLVVETATDHEIVVEGPVSIPASTGTGYVHDQTAAAKTWTIDHPLTFRPSVTVVDASGLVVVPEVEFVSSSRIVITHAEARSGSAYLS